MYCKADYVPDNIKNIVTANEADYTKVAKLYYNDYFKHNKDVLVYSDMTSSGKVFLYDSEFDYEILLSDEEYACCKKLFDNYRLDKKSCDRVFVYHNFVSFSNENGRESLVYSVDGSRPKYVNQPEDVVTNISSGKITENWYYMMGER